MKRATWADLDEAARARVLQRPAVAASAAVHAEVLRILAMVRADGDTTLRALTRRFDNVEIGDLAVGAAEIDAAAAALPASLRDAIDEAHARIAAFHRATAPAAVTLETAPGVLCERLWRPIATVGLYVPAGSAPLPSTALMLGVPAQIAGCGTVVLCSPPRADGSCDPAVLYAARRCGITRVFRLGGAQAIAAMGIGTASVPRCDKLFGPGNAWVTEAKCQLAAMPNGPAIDMPAGPSELLVIADAAADPAFVAADLLSQAEHGADSQVVLVSDSDALIEAALTALESQLAALPRAALARQALAQSHALHVASLEAAFDISNAYAPEHLIVNVRDARSWLPRVRAAGSVFLGAWSPETVGDYCSGTNHVLPTYGHARAWSGVSVASFQTAITVQELSAPGLAAIGPCAMTLARAEGLVGHERAVAVRLAAPAGDAR